MKKTATVTWITWLNYGSYLQAYALQHVIKSLGYENAIIDDERIVYPLGKHSNDAWLRDLPFYKQVYLRIKQRLISYIRNTDAKKIEKRYKRFRKKYLTIDNSFNELEELNNKYDVFIAGSDQIWAPTKEVFKPYYYLNFARKKKISYAASINSDFYPDDFKLPVSELLKDFSHISVRENDGKVLLESFIQKKIEVSLDPTLLLTANEWQIVANKRHSRRLYVLCYFLSYNETYLEYARNFARQRNLPLYFFSTNNQYRPFADKMVAAGPSEFISYIRNASFVLTDSFHGTVFSILHEKEFITFKRFKGKSASNQNERLNNLFRITGINGRFLGEHELYETHIATINYSYVNHKIEIERDKSIKYLKDALAN